MTALAARIADRLTLFGISFSEPQLAGLTSYVELLQKWNTKVNLTALSLVEPVPVAALDKLVVEPLCASPLWPEQVETWYDLGSGGGSPAVPLRIFHPGGDLAMVEARGRKCAFLSEAVRVLGLPRTHVLNKRFEDLATNGAVDLVTVRAVRPDATFSRIAAKLLRAHGVLLGFGCSVSGAEFVADADAPLPDGSRVIRFRKNVPRGTLVESMTLVGNDPTERPTG